MECAENQKAIRWQSRLLFFVLAVLSSVQLLFAIPAGQVVAELKNKDNRCGIRQEIRIIPVSAPWNGN